MTAKKPFTLDDSAMARALATFAKGPEAFKQLTAAAEVVWGCDSDTFLKAFNAQKFDAARGVSFANVATEAKGFKPTKGLLKILAFGAEHVKAFSVTEQKDSDGKVTTPAQAPRLTYVVEYTPAVVEQKDSKGKVTVTASDATATLAVTAGRVRSKGKASEGANISAPNAVKKGIAAGDTFKLETVKDSNGKTEGFKVDGRFVPSKKNGGLCRYILKVHPNSHSAAILRDHGKTLD